MNNFKHLKYKNIIGASLLEVVLALGVMILLTPVVIELAFKDVKNIKNMSIAKQLMQVERSIAAYAAIKREDWPMGEGDIDISELSDYGLDASIDEQIFDNLKIKYNKSDQNKVSVYGLIDMTSFNFEKLEFNETLLYVGDHIGYVIKDEECGDCTAAICVCGINGSWSKDYQDVSADPVGDNEDLAVIFVDDTLLEDEYSSNIYLYRNSQGGINGNVMGRSLSLGGHSIKEAENINVLNLYGKTASESVTSLKASEVNLRDDINVLNALVVSENVISNIIADTFLKSPNLRFFDVLNLISFSAIDAVLQRPSITTPVTPKIIVDATAEFFNLEIQNLLFSSLDNSYLQIKGYETSGSSKLKANLPNLNSPQMEAKIININNAHISNGDVYSSNGVLYFNSSPLVNIFNVHGQTSDINPFVFAAELTVQSAALKDCIDTGVCDVGEDP